MPRRIILHAGFHKTGTTTVQNFLRANRPALKKHVAIRLKPQMRALVHATRAYSRDRDRATFDHAQSEFSVFLADLPPMPRRTLIVSTPDLSGRLPGVGNTVDYSAAADLLYGFVSAIRAQLPHSEPVLFLSTRDPRDWLQSAYWDHVRNGKMALDFSDFAARCDAGADVRTLARDIAARVPCITHCVDIEDCASTPFGLASSLLDICDLPEGTAESLSAEPPANQTPSIDVLLQLLAANRTAGTDTALRTAKQAVLARAGWV